ncbi:hypothetical protein BDZ97DRAFT_1409321 [Flammula alnicola]|nr:hypothetical protein BDZ97DRAFT_1409321 [Flammula alnicola]
MSGRRTRRRKISPTQKTSLWVPKRHEDTHSPTKNHGQGAAMSESRPYDVSHPLPPFRVQIWAPGRRLSPRSSTFVVGRTMHLRRASQRQRRAAHKWQDSGRDNRLVGRLPWSGHGHAIAHNLRSPHSSRFPMISSSTESDEVEGSTSRLEKETLSPSTSCCIESKSPASLSVTRAVFKSLLVVDCSRWASSVWKPWASRQAAPVTIFARMRATAMAQQAGTITPLLLV